MKYRLLICTPWKTDLLSFSTKADTFVKGLTLLCTSLFWVIVFRNHDFVSVEFRYISWFVPSSKVFVLDCSSAPCSLKPHTLRCARRQLCWIWVIGQTLFCQGLGVVLSFFYYFCIFRDLDTVSVHWQEKKERGQYRAILTEQAGSIKDFFIYRLKQHYFLAGQSCRG